jgi:hypothetical protein
LYLAACQQSLPQRVYPAATPAAQDTEDAGEFTVPQLADPVAPLIAGIVGLIWEDFIL